MEGTGYTLKKLVFIKSMPKGPDQVLHTDSEQDFISMLCGLNCDLCLNVNLSPLYTTGGVIDLDATVQKEFKKGSLLFFKANQFVHGGCGHYRDTTKYRLFASFERQGIEDVPDTVYPVEQYLTKKCDICKMIKHRRICESCVNQFKKFCAPCFKVYANLGQHRYTTSRECRAKNKSLRAGKKVFCRQCLKDFKDKEALKEHREAMTCFREYRRVNFN